LSCIHIRSIGLLSYITCRCRCIDGYAFSRNSMKTKSIELQAITTLVHVPGGKRIRVGKYRSRKFCEKRRCLVVPCIPIDNSATKWGAYIDTYSTLKCCAYFVIVMCNVYIILYCRRIIICECETFTIIIILRVPV
jgi:hypothetical protein